RYSLHDVTVDGIDANQLNGSGTLIAILNDWPTNVLNSILINHITGFPDSGRHLLTLEDKVSNPKMWGFRFTNNVVLARELPVWTESCATNESGKYSVQIDWQQRTHRLRNGGGRSSVLPVRLSLPAGARGKAINHAGYNVSVKVRTVELVQDLLYSSRADPHSLGLSSPNAS